MKKIFIVENHQAIRETLAEILRDLGYAVEEAEGGADALRLLHAGADASLILLDLNMPHMSGADFCVQKESEPALVDIPVVVMTASSETPESSPIHAQGWLRKPFHFETLLSLVEKYAGATAGGG